MQEKPKRERPAEDESDRERRSYYYDDAHGYEDYDPEAEDDDEVGKKNEPDQNRPHASSRRPG